MAARVAAAETRASVVIEIDPAAERHVDARSTRRLVPLELADVTVPPAPEAGSERAALFFRVLGQADRTLLVELWERGTFHGARTLVLSQENAQLVARRVALAAAELGRRLAQLRLAELERRRNTERLRLARQRLLAERTRDGPRALRSELALGGTRGFWSFGPRLAAELHVHRRLRLDTSAELGFGRTEPALPAAVYGLAMGPAQRFVLSNIFQVDAALDAGALLLRIPGAARLDGLAHQDASWSARVRGALRFELRLSRETRALAGVELGVLLRSVRYWASESEHELSGSWLGASFGLVTTPAP